MTDQIKKILQIWVLATTQRSVMERAAEKRAVMASVLCSVIMTVTAVRIYEKNDSKAAKKSLRWLLLFLVGFRMSQGGTGGLARGML